MSHDTVVEGQEALESARIVPVVNVNHAEYEKFCYLIKVMDALDRAHVLSKEKLLALKFSDGFEGYTDFEWRPVAQFVTPQLQVVFLKDRNRDQYAQNFMQFPVAAIVARTAVVVDLDSEFELCLEGHDAHQSIGNATNALRVLESEVRSLEGRRQVDAERSLHQLRRSLKIEL